MKSVIYDVFEFLGLTYSESNIYEECDEICEFLYEQLDNI